MICTYCHNDNPNVAQYCSQCGKPTLINAKANSINPNVIAVFVYLAYKLIVIFCYRAISYVIIPAMLKENNYEAVGGIYDTANVIFFLLELVVFGVIIALVKNLPVRIAVGIMAFITIGLFILEKAIKMAY